MKTPTEAISGFFLGTTPIKYRGQQGHATGFFLNYDDTTFLITNKHVVNIKTHNNNPIESVRIYIRPNPDNVEETESLDLTIYSTKSRNWIKHKDHRVDLAAIPLTEPVVSEPVTVQSYDPLQHTHEEIDRNYTMGNLAFSLDDLPATHTIVDGTIATVIRGGSQAMILGYPQYVSQNKLPIARSALISSPYGISEPDQPFFRVDARTHDGLSGSPVFTTVSESTASARIQEDKLDVVTAAKLLRDAEWNLIGVHAQSSDRTASLGLNDAFYPHLIHDIIDEHD